MNKKGHLILGFIIGFIFLLLMNQIKGWFNILDYKSWIIYLLIFIIYSLLADIDHKMSTITWMFMGLGITGIIGAFYTNNRMLAGISIILLAITYIAAEWFPHRGPTHTIWFAALSCIPVYFLIGLHESILSFVVYYSHLIGDKEFFKI